MKKGTIFRNLWASNETYFVYMGYPVRTGRCEAKATGGYGLVKHPDGWKFERATYYVQSLKDPENFPVVGYIDMDNAMKDAIISAIAEYLKPEGGGEDG